MPSILLLGLLGLAQAAAGADSTRALIEAIEHTRAAKDSLLRHGDDSPLLPADRAAFAGLRYYPIDLAYRLVGALHIYGRRRLVEVPDTAGGTIEMERFGRLYLTWRGKEFWLEVYRHPQDGILEVFFKDQTNGKTTYSGGRYARVEHVSDGDYLIDFNNAYNPYCAYDPSYVCPLPPPQNALPFAIEAGELDFGADLAE